MAGFWEQGPSVLAAVLHVDITTVAWALGIKNLQLPGEFLPLSGMPYDHSRNMACQVALQRGFSHVFMLDSDVIPPRDTVLRLLAHRQPIISGLYHRRSPPHGVPVMIRNGVWVSPRDYDLGSVIEVDLVGSGCMLVERSVLERLPPLALGKPFFHWKVDLMGHVPAGEALSEDFAFDLHARRHGYKILVDTGIKCRHVGFFEVTEGDARPLETTSNT